MLSQINAYLPTIFMTSLLTIALSLLTMLASILFGKAKTYLISSLTINNSDPLFQILLEYLKENQYIDSPNLACSTKQGTAVNNINRPNIQS